MLTKINFKNSALVLGTFVLLGIMFFSYTKSNEKYRVLAEESKVSIKDYSKYDLRMEQEILKAKQKAIEIKRQKAQKLEIEKQHVIENLKNLSSLNQETINSITERVNNASFSEIETIKLEAEEANKNAESQLSHQANNTQAGSVILSNGNTAGTVGLYAAQRMSEATGVSASTWEHIIARESGGNPNAHNPSGAHGLFQTMEQIWGRSETVDGQIAIAITAYNEAQRIFGNGLQPWGM